MTDIVLLAVSPTMEKGTLARWLVPAGTVVKKGDAIAEIETDKASVELVAEVDGVLSEILVMPGTSDVPVGTVLGRLGTESGNTTVSATASETRVQGSAVAAPPPAKQLEKAAHTKTVAQEAPTLPSSDHVLASPLARRLARQLGIDLNTVRGTGSHGRITKQDLETVDARLRLTRSAGLLQTTLPSADVIHPPPNVPHETQPLSAMRKTIARRLSESKRTVPHFYMSVDVLMDGLVQLREQCNARPSAEKLSLNDFIVRAAALALKKVPAANVQFGGDVVHRFQRVDISMAVAVTDGLYTPVIRDAANKSVAVIAAETKALVEKARSGKLHPLDYEGGTFSISNLGMYGVKQFEAVINPPQAAILAVGAVERRVVPNHDDSVSVRKMITATLSCDHRVIDGAVGAELLGEIKRRIEDPLGLLLG